jgi:hypothetical protein
MIVLFSFKLSFGWWVLFNLELDVFIVESCVYFCGIEQRMKVC